MLNSTISRQAHTFSFNEYYGEIGSFSAIMEMKAGSNESWRWPHNISEGFFHARKIRPGLGLAIIDHYAETPVNLYFNERDTVIELTFVLAGDGNIAMADTLSNRHDFSCSHSKAYLLFSSGVTGTITIPHFSYRTINILVEPWLFREFLPEKTSLFTLVDNALHAPFSFPSLTSSFSFTPIINILLHEIIDCPFEGSRKRYFLESKVLEILLLAVKELTGHSDLSQNPPVQRKDSLAEEVRNILLVSLANPPSLEELACRIGTNRNKLTNSFRQAYGVTIFEYLRIYRMEKAKEFLQSRTKSISQIALELGYSEQSAFSKQFKKYFGTSPRNFMK